MKRLNLSAQIAKAPEAAVAAMTRNLRPTNVTFEVDTSLWSPRIRNSISYNFRRGVATGGYSSKSMNASRLLAGAAGVPMHQFTNGAVWFDKTYGKREQIEEFVTYCLTMMRVAADTDRKRQHYELVNDRWKRGTLQCITYAVANPKARDATFMRLLKYTDEQRIAAQKVVAALTSAGTISLNIDLGGWK